MTHKTSDEKTEQVQITDQPMALCGGNAKSQIKTHTYKQLR